MFHRFQHEAEFYPELNRLPLHTRMKLDIAGLKISLKEWLAFAREERRAICYLPVESEEELAAFIDYVNFLCKRYQGSAAPTLPPLSPTLWNTPHQIPKPVREVSRASERAIDLNEWTRLQPHERYALFKTALSKNEPEKFLAVLTELRQRENAT
jgi:hypothetical protein